jgi:hypothetical protein
MTRMHNVPPLTPELDKMLAATKKGSQKIREFLEWMRSERNIKLMETVDYCGELSGSYIRAYRCGINELLAEYYGIDLDEVERERMLVLQNFRVQQGMTPDGGPIEGGDG